MYKFKGKYQDLLKSKFFSNLSSDKFFKYASLKEHQNELSNGFIKLNITDERTIEYHPTFEQIEAINYFIVNEERIYQEVFNQVRQTILPTEKTYYDIKDYNNDELNYWFPKLDSIEDLKEVLGFSSIGIDIAYRNKVALTNLNFEFSANEEHGLTIVFERDKFLAYGQTSGYDHQGIMSEREFKEYLNKLNKKHPLQIWEAENESGKLKPWQERANQYYPFGLIYENRPKELIMYLKRNKEYAEQEIDKLIENSIWHKRTEITE